MKTRKHLFGFIIMVLLRKALGQCDATTRPMNLTTSPTPQYVTSPNYGVGMNYPHNSDCEWRIINPNDGRVIINVQDAKFDSGDSVSIYDGDSASSTRLASGTYSASARLNEFVSTGSTIYIDFTSDAFFYDDGFNALYFSADPGHFSADPAVYQQCSETYNATLQPQYLMSANIPDLYSGNYSCTSYFQSTHEYYTLTFTLYFLDVQETNGCVNDKFEVSEGPDVDNLTPLHTACTTAQTYDFSDIVSVYSFASVSLTTDDDTTNYLGFLLGFVEVFQGITLSYPAENETIQLTVSEDLPVGIIDTTLARVNVNTTGTNGIGFTFTQGENNSVTTLFTVSAGPDVYYLLTNGNLDYEDTDLYNLTITKVDNHGGEPMDLAHYNAGQCFVDFSINISMVDNTYPGLSATARFLLNVTDVDDVAPVFTNLPNSTNVYRTKPQGYQVFTVSAKDADRTPAFTEVVYTIYSGDSLDLLLINSSSGEIELAKDASTVSIAITSYIVQIAAYSVNMSYGLFTFEGLTLNIPLDSPPECVPNPATGSQLTSDLDGAGTVIKFTEPWNCTDDKVNITYSIVSVTPNLTTPLFSVDSSTGTITLLRTFSIGEVPSRLFVVELGATDSMNQTTSLYIEISVTALHCSPATIYVRMDAEIGSDVMTDFNCTGSNKSSLQLAIHAQFPDDTFTTSGSSLILNSPVYKIRFYSLTLEISNGVDTETVDCKVTVRMRQCTAVLNGSRMTSPENILILLAAQVVVYFT